MSGTRLRARDVMTAPVITVRPETTVKDIAALMLAHHISGVPVVSDEGALVGIVTEADLLYKEAGEARPDRGFFWELPPFGRGPEVARRVEGLRARDLMSAPVVTVEEDTPLREVARLMVRRGINRVPVMQAGLVVGIVSRADVLRAFTRDDGEIARMVRESLLRDLWVDVSKIRIDVRDGVVYLDGTVERRSEMDLVTRWAGTIDGVMGVESRLTYEYDDRAVSLGSRWPPERV